jgi:enamine deaminase RidA (YjgF/YER057c/UK114 family)
VACVDFRKAASRDTVTLCCETNCSFKPSLPEESMKIFSLFSLIVLISSAHAGARQDAKVVMDADPEEAKFQAEWGYASAIRVGDTIYLSGDVAVVRKGETDLTLAYERAFKDIGEALKSAGATWDDVVDITTFHTDLTTQMPAIVAVKNRYIKAPFPAWTAIQVARLIPTNGITEIKIVAKASR